MEKNNKLIAEFMNYPKCSDYWNDGRFLEEDYKDYYYVRGQYDACYNSSNFHVNDMKFGLSWDWLIPVIEKIQDNYIENPELDYKYIDEIRLAVPNIQEVHYLIVEFIKDYNDGKDK
tara:strand:- start:8712 stop:9062 length:351 start_codon:yes stop_codon:yes gene_type:complete